MAQTQTSIAPFRFEDLPIDLHGEVFAHLTSPSDLLHVAQASKLFFRLAIRLLYQDIYYDTPAHFFHNLTFWDRNWSLWGLQDQGLENILETPRSVVIGKELGHGLTIDHYYVESHIARTRLRFGTDLGLKKSREFFPPALDCLSELLMRFPNLHSISFQQALFSFKLDKLLNNLPPSIRSLSFEQCTFLTPTPPLETRDSMPLLSALKSYTGPVDFLRSTLRGCDGLERIVFPSSIRDVDALMSDTLPYTASTSTRFFDVTLQKWDIEIMHAVIAELPGLEELRIRVWDGFPDENVLVSFGPEFLSRLPNIRVLHLYCLFPSGGTCGLPDAHECMVSWEKYSPKLREVRLVDTSVWRKAGDGNGWCRVAAVVGGGGN